MCVPGLPASYPVATIEVWEWCVMCWGQGRIWLDPCTSVFCWSCMGIGSLPPSAAR